MKTNLTIKIEISLVREAKILAAKEGTSISALVGETLESIVRERKHYNRAKKRALARMREGLDLRWVKPGSRDELHER